MNRLRALKERGQAVWLDYIRRDILVDGTLARLVEEDGISGLTSNPSIFQQAIGEGDLYDAAIRQLLEEHEGISEIELYEELAIQDIRMAADLLMPTYEATAAGDGYVSLEVSPHLARDTIGSIAEARRLWRRVDRPNLLIKIPATEEGTPAVEALLTEGINVNVTLMFSLDHYEAVAQAFLRALPRCSRPERMASVASFFVSRVDTKVDQALESLATVEARRLAGKIAIANAKLAYQRYRQLFESAGFAEWRRRGARPQRVLWASTSTKDPSYRDVVYVEELIGPDTVNTVPPQTLDAFRDHGEVRDSLLESIEGARVDLAALEELGISLSSVTDELQQEGVQKFARPFDALMETLRRRCDELTAPRPAEGVAD